MKKFITILVVIGSSAYYTCLPFVLTHADNGPAVETSTAGASTLKVAPAPAVATSSVVSVLDMRITAYASVPDETDDTPFTTADGSRVADGIAASNILPFGTRIQIPALFGDKIFVIHDRMSQRIKNTIDLWMPTVAKALYFGAQKASILVLGTPTSTPTFALLK